MMLCSLRAFDIQPPAVAHQDVFDDGEPKASATGHPRASAINTIEALREPRQMFGRDAFAVIPNREMQFGLLHSK